MTLEPSISPGVWRIDTAPPGALILSEATVEARSLTDGIPYESRIPDDLTAMSEHLQEEA